MLDNFYKYLETEDKLYLKLANKQLREILKGAGFGILLVLPFSPITIPYLFKRAEKLGIDIIPSWYKKLDLNDDEKALLSESVDAVKSVMAVLDNMNANAVS